MEKRRFLFVIILLLSVITKMHAQWEAPFSQYWEVKEYFNPSFAGSANYIKTTALYRYQWAGISNSPQQIVINANMPFQFMNHQHGAGITFHTNNIGSLKNTQLTAQYSFKKKIGNGFLNIGIQAGIYDLNFDAGSITTNTDSLQTNQVIIHANTTEKQVADFSTGISWTSNRFYAGVSLMHINQARFYITDTDSAQSLIPRTLNFMTAYNIKPNNSLEIQPMVSIYASSSQSIAQTTLRVEYNKKLSGGASWISNNGYSFFAGANIKGLRLGYSYSLHNKGIGADSKGSHELYLNYDFPLNSFKPRYQPHKSIRLL